MTIPEIEDVQAAASVISRHVSPAPLIRSWRLERELGLPESRRVWLKDYGWTPVGSFKLLGALNWMHRNLDRIGDRPVVAHSSGNFACGISFAAMRYGKQVHIVMPDTAPRVKFEMAQSFGAVIQTYNIATDHETGDRDRITRELAEEQHAVQASPYDDPYVISGNGVGGLEIVDELAWRQRSVSHFVCPVSGGGLMAGHALVIGELLPATCIVGVEPAGADDFRQSLEAGEIIRLDRPASICDGLLSYDVGQYNWPILQEYVALSVTAADSETLAAMRWLYDNHGLRCEPSGAIAAAAALHGKMDLSGSGDIVIVISGRNLDDDQFRRWIESADTSSMNSRAELP
ncbi:MAG: threonine/serine dehydratase [Planctomycetaceae bacterium]|nr:threonine/serine dehydratase [Planctomycetaceae bacterium]